MSDNLTVKVALRVRPLVTSELSKGCKEILDVIEENEQIIVRSIDKDKSFTYNYVFSTMSLQSELYERAVQPLIGNLFKGYNVTILAYGQTGSGKTHTMGTTYIGEGDMGVIPRAIGEIFEYVSQNSSIDYTITVSFMELYQEVLYDLLSDKQRDQCALEIREEITKGIHIPGLTEVPVKTSKDVLEALQRGALKRVTGCTAMNSQSSRSHAIFTVNMSMNDKENSQENKQAKLHLVDLAGSERPKKTGAMGNTFKEGVNINKGLFVLGNVISCLGDDKGQHGFIPYRDSNLTRLLKDSLGGNSITLMIACVSPADYNIDETLSTLRYADRARKIKNKPIVNQDIKLAEINDLKKTIQQLRLQIIEQGGPMVCPAEIELLKKEIIDLKVKIRDLTLQLSHALVDNTGLHEKIMILQKANEALNKKILEVKDQYDVTFNNISVAFEHNDIEMIKENLSKLQLIQSQFAEINSEQKKTEEEIRHHEDLFNKQLMNATSMNDATESKEIEEISQTHTTRQMDLNMQLHEIHKQLVIKESLAKQLVTNNQYMVDLQAMEENESKIANLQTEKQELLQQLKAVGNSGKLADNLKKRVHELEANLAELKTKVQEQARLIKLKAKDEERISRLNKEIIQMKQAKVKLVRTMREETDKFKQWRLQKERECLRLKQQDRKKENEIVKMKVMHNKQQIVFKRRVEQAEALNKRLKSVLALRQQAHDAKNTGKLEKIEPWLKQEYDLYINMVEAEATLKELLDDRATLRQQLEELKSNPETENSHESKSIEDDLELRSVQIQDLQQKILDLDEESKAKTRYEKFQTMAEAKHALKFMFARAADSHIETIQTRSKLNELQEMFNEAQEKLKSMEAQYKLLGDENTKQMLNSQREYEEKIAILLRQIRGVNDREDVNKDQELKEMVDIQHENIRAQEQKIQQLELLNKELTEKMDLIMKVSKQQIDNMTPYKNEKSPKKIPQIQLSSETFVVEHQEDELVEISDSSIIMDDDIQNDPDWRKTPLGKRIIEEKKKIHSIFKSNSTLDFGEDKPVKRSSDGGCTCKTNCVNARCGCRKLRKSCSTSCRCSDDLCENKYEETSPQEQTLLFRKPSMVESSEPTTKKRLKKTRQLFTLNL